MRLNVGCGPVRPDGWVNIDPYPGPDRAKVVVANPLDRLPFSEATFDGAVAHHVLQMLPDPELGPWLAEVRRVLRPGGILRVTVPDLLGAFDAYDENNPGWFPIDDAVAPSLDAKFCLYVSQGGATRSVFTDDWLREAVVRAGFVVAWCSGTEILATNAGGYTIGPPWLCDLDSRFDESIVLEAVA